MAHTPLVARTAVVTGAASGMGAATARLLAAPDIEPGLTDTELGTHIDNPELGPGGQLGAMFDAIGPLGADEIADLVGYVTSRPRHVNLRQIVILPTRQA